MITLKEQRWMNVLISETDLTLRNIFDPKDIQIFFDKGDEVGFKTTTGNILKGKITKLNPRAARVKCENVFWKVPYPALHHMSDKRIEEGVYRAKKLHNVIHKARNLMDHHGIKEWKLNFSSATTRLGCCIFSTKTIQLSYFHIIKGHDNQIEDTILHEIAHALAGPKEGHGNKWKRIAEQIGATPKSCAPTSQETIQLIETAKTRFNVGDAVYFNAKGKEHLGKILRLNSKRASILVNQSKWLVPYTKLNK